MLNFTCIVDHWYENVFPLKSKQATFTTYFIVCENASWRDPSSGLNIFIQKGHLSHSKLCPWERRPKECDIFERWHNCRKTVSFDWNVLTATHYQKEQSQGHKFMYTDLLTKNSVMTQRTKATNEGLWGQWLNPRNLKRKKNEEKRFAKENTFKCYFHSVCSVEITVMYFKFSALVIALQMLFSYRSMYYVSAIELQLTYSKPRKEFSRQARSKNCLLLPFSVEVILGDTDTDPA